MKLTRLNRTLFLIPITFFWGCGVLVGSVKPVTEPSSDFSILDLHQLRPAWQNVDSPSKHPSNEPQVSYQLKAYGNLIALNSTCRPRFASETLSLNDALNSLLQGFGNVQARTDQFIVIDQRKALYSSGSLRIENRPMQYEAVMARDGDCLFDLMHLSSQKHFIHGTEDFSRFYKSMKFKK